MPCPAGTYSRSICAASLASVSPGSDPSSATRWSSCAVAEEDLGVVALCVGKVVDLLARAVRVAVLRPAHVLLLAQPTRLVLLVLLLCRLGLFGVHRVPRGRVGLFCRP